MVAWDPLRGLASSSAAPPFHQDRSRHCLRAFPPVPSPQPLTTNTPMHPAFSVIFFTTLSGAGYGLLAMVAALALQGDASSRVLVALLLLALALVTVGLLSSLGHLGKPLRAWRAVSQWRTSWLSREGLAALLTYLPALALGVG